MTNRSDIASSASRYFFPAALTDGQRRIIRSAVEDSAATEIDKRIMFLRSKAHEYQALSNGSDCIDNLRVAVVFSILSDLVSQGWIVRVNDYHLVVEAASFNPIAGETVDHAKKRIRKGLQIASNRHLAKPSVKQFLHSMEQERDFKGHNVSIVTLVDDGADLSKRLENVHLASAPEQPALINKFFKPVLQECASGARCRQTGIKLQDIWRYFRYTWSLEYNPLPGRTQRFLLRNAARKHHPVIGIAMLASPTANLGSRDEWIGWQLDQLTAALVEGLYDARLTAKRLIEALRLSVSEIRSDDLATTVDLSTPDLNTILRLERIGAQATARRKADLSEAASGDLVDIRGVGKTKLTDEDWRNLSDTGLFRKKRAEQLIPLLRAIETLHAYGIDKEPATALYVALTEKQGRTSVRVALNELKKRRLATEVADLAVCGAIAPYNKILGGKLVALAMTSREARNLYRKRYTGQISEIASQISGHAVTRSADLKLLTTTSLYGIGSNQYTGLKLRSTSFPELTGDVVWKKLRSGQGVSITHISDTTVALMRKLGSAVYGRRRINSVFGEGSSPRMRQIKEGLNLIGVNDESVLKQSHGRKVYGCELYRGAKDDVLGIASGGKSRTSPSLKAITQAWTKRWLIPRIGKESLLHDLSITDAADIQQELQSRIAQGELLLAHPSENDDDARASAASISEATSRNDDDVSGSTSRIAASAAANN